MQESEHQVHFFRQLNETPEVGKVVEIPAGVDDKGFMLDFYARAFQFPDWFGHNWDALLDCLRDVYRTRKTPNTETERKVWNDKTNRRQWRNRN